MIKKYFLECDRCFKSAHLRVLFEQEYEDIRDIMCDSVKPEWQATGNFYIKVEEIHTSVETTQYKDAVVTRTTQDIGRELAFHGDTQFADHLQFIAQKFDNFDTVVNAARVLMPQM